MRLWTLHPEYLDPRGLVALWREALLAQAVLAGETRGYRHHPQLIRFRETTSPGETIAAYLQEVHAEATRRGYRFDATKIGPTCSGFCVEPLMATRGQVDYEWEHLKAKLQVRSAEWLAGLGTVRSPRTHPLFRIVPGPIAAWEVTPAAPPA